MPNRFYTWDEIYFAQHMICFLVVLGLVAIVAACLRSRLVMLVGALGAHLGYTLGNMGRAIRSGSLWYDWTSGFWFSCGGALLGCIVAAAIDKKYPSPASYSLRGLLVMITFLAIFLALVRLAFNP